jgi:hypothetical protein
MKLRLKTTLIILALAWLPPCASSGQTPPEHLAQAIGQQPGRPTLNDPGNIPNERQDAGSEPNPQGVRIEEKTGRNPDPAQELPEGSRNRKVIAKPAPKGGSGMGTAPNQPNR